MKFKAQKFSDPNAQRVYDNYFKSMGNVLKPILASDREEVMMEFNSHIFENIQKNNSATELDALLDSIDKLGSPEEVLQPLVADKIIDKAVKTFNPLDIGKALILNITNGISYLIFALLYLFLGSSIFLIFAKLFNSNVGMFVKDGNYDNFAIGIIDDPSGYDEVLGNWFIPLVIIVTLLLYFFITLLLKFKKSLTKK